MLDLTNYDELVPASLHWEPEINEIQTKDGTPIESHRGIYRSDTGELIGVVGTHYKVVPHSDLIAGVHEALDSAGLTDAKRTLQVHEGGAKIHGRYTFPKHVIEPAVGDVMELCMDLRTSHNGSWGVALDFQYNRLICTNGMVRGDRIGRNRGRHTENFSITAFLRQMQEAIDMMSKDQERFEKMVVTRVTEADAEWFFRETIARRPREFKRTRGVKDKPFEIERERPCFLGLYRQLQCGLPLYLGRNTGAFIL